MHHELPQPTQHSPRKRRRVENDEVPLRSSPRPQSTSLRASHIFHGAIASIKQRIASAVESQECSSGTATMMVAPPRLASAGTSSPNRKRNHDGSSRKVDTSYTVETAQRSVVAQSTDAPPRLQNIINSSIRGLASTADPARSLLIHPEHNVPSSTVKKIMAEGSLSFHFATPSPSSSSAAVCPSRSPKEFNPIGYRIPSARHEQHAERMLVALLLQIECDVEGQLARLQAFGEICGMLRRANITPELFGSMRAGTCLPASDIDIHGTPSVPMTASHLAKLLFRSSRMVSNVQSRGRAKVPIVKCRHRSTGVFVDIALNASDGAKSSDFLAARLFELPPARGLVILVKLLVRGWGLSDASRGGLSGFCISLMVLHYIHREFNAAAAAGKTVFMCFISLLRGFCKYFGTEFDYCNFLADPSDGQTYRKAPSLDFHIRNPLSPDRNAASACRLFGRQLAPRFEHLAVTLQQHSSSSLRLPAELSLPAGIGQQDPQSVDDATMDRLRRDLASVRAFAGPIIMPMFGGLAWSNASA